jgi:hypothetical protein
MPCRSVSRTVSSVARKNAIGMEPSSTSIRNVTPEPAAAGPIRSPMVARNGLGSSCSRSTAAPGPAIRSTQIVVVSRKLTSRPSCQ